MSERDDLVERLRAASHDERLSTGALYATAADEIERLRQLCAAAYQMAGVVGAPVRFLDALSRHDDVTQEQIDALLPVFPHEFDALARPEAAAREAVAAWMIEHAFATGHGDTLTDLLAELSWQIAEIKRDAIKWRDTPIPVPPGECPYPVHADHSIKACVDAGDCGCGEDRK